MEEFNDQVIYKKLRNNWIGSGTYKVLNVSK